MMKKFTMTAAAAAALLAAGAAQAYTMGTFSNGVVVPNVIHNGAQDTTAVGIVNQAATPVAVYWVFHGQDSEHVTDGCFTMTSKDFRPFVWSAESGVGLENRRGYLVFAVSATAPTGAACPTGAATLAADAQQISANAFQVDLANADLAYIPVVDGPLTINGDLTTMGPTNLTAAAGAAQVAAAGTTRFVMRYFVDGQTGGTDTAIAVWSTGDHSGTHTVNMYNDAQDRKSVNFEMTRAELDWFNPETIVGRPANYTDGFIEWQPGLVRPADSKAAAGQSLAELGGSVFTYSLISAPAFGAVQTVLGAHTPN